MKQSVIVFSLIFFINSLNSYAQDTVYTLEKLKPVFEVPQQSELIKIQGKIVDRDTQLPISLVNVNIKNKWIGTLSDKQGEFQLIILEQYRMDTLRIGLIDHKVEYISINNSTNLRIELDNEAIVMDEMVIESSFSDSEFILENVIDKIPENYITNAYTLEVLSQQQYVDKRTNELLAYTLLAEVYDQNGYASSSSIDDKGFFRVKENGLYAYDSLLSECIPLDSYKELYFEDIPRAIWGFSRRDYVHYRNYTFLNKRNLKY
jgi:hypothetical protein